MGISAKLEERMLSEAEFGAFYIYAKISKKKASELRRVGFNVLDPKETKKSSKAYRISWEWNVIEGDVSEMDENSDQYRFPEKLWIVSTKATLQ